MSSPYWNADFIEKTTGGERLGDAGAATREFRAISTDTRSIGEGDWFVALKGPNFDGHDYIGAAFDAGVRGFVVERAFAPSPAHSAAVFVRVPDTLAALGDIAHAHRLRFRIPLVAITGSNGKTTTKEMLGAILSVHFGDRVLVTRGNFNNLIGLPLTLFHLNGEHRAAVVEMGMSRRGEIRRLAEIASADIGVVTNVSPVHLEHLTNIRDVAEAKRELFERFDANQVAVLNADDPLVFEMSRVGKFPVRSFGIDNPADVTAADIATRSFEGIDFTLRIGETFARVALTCVGRHNVHNALAAAAAATQLDVPIETIVAGLESFRPAAMRMRILDILRVKVIDDTYNSSPRSMDAALSTLQELAGDGRQVVVMGDMKELGAETEAAHRRVGRHIAKNGVWRLVVIGESARWVVEGATEEGMKAAQIVHAENHRDIVEYLRNVLGAGDVVLVKGSRVMRMELVVRGLKGEAF